MTTILFAFLTSCAFSLPFELLDTAEIAARMSAGSIWEKYTAFLPVLGSRMFPHGGLLFLLFFLLYRVVLPKIRGKQFSLSALLTAVLFSLYLLFGECASLYADLRPLFSNMPQILISVIKCCGYLPLFYTVIRAGFVLIDGTKPGSVTGKTGRAVFEEHCFLLPLLIILFCWLPYLIAFYPGFVPSDGLKQLNNFFGSGNFTDNHPAFSSMLMGWAMMLGRKLGSDNLGLFLFTGPQMLICAAVMAACFPLFRQLRTPGVIRKLALADFALIPIWPNYAYSLLKDSLYMAMILLFVLQLIRIIRDPEKFCGKPGNLILMCASMCLMVMVRHEGQYVGGVIFLTLFTLPAVRRFWKRLLPVLLVPLCLINVFDRVIRPQLGIADAPAREALTMPIRQTSAVVVEMEDSLTEEESAVLHELFVYEKIPAMYAESFQNADALKGQFDPWAPREAILRYMKVWAGLGLKHPLTYLNVFLCSNTRYYDPFLGVHRDIYGWFGIEQAEYVNKGLFDLRYDPAFGGLRTVLTNIADGMPRLPLTALFYSLGFSAWVMIFCLASLLRKKVRGIIIPLLPGLVTFIMLQNSAINGFFRYMLPLLIPLPVCIAWTVSRVQETN